MISRIIYESNVTKSELVHNYLSTFSTASSANLKFLPYNNKHYDSRLIRLRGVSSNASTTPSAVVRPAGGAANLCKTSPLWPLLLCNISRNCTRPYRCADTLFEAASTKLPTQSTAVPSRSQVPKVSTHSVLCLLLQTTPLIILFQHNSLKAVEWNGIRRELTSALRKLDTQLLAQGRPKEDLIGEYIKLQVIKTTMFEPALRIAEYYQPKPQSQEEKLLPVKGGHGSGLINPSLTHALSESAYRAIKKHKGVHP